MPVVVGCSVVSGKQQGLSVWALPVQFSPVGLFVNSVRIRFVLYAKRERDEALFVLPLNRNTRRLLEGTT